jgi:hypothetical protein
MDTASPRGLFSIRPIYEHSPTLLISTLKIEAVSTSETQGTLTAVHGAETQSIGNTDRASVV